MRYIEEGQLGLGSTMLPVAEGSGEGELWSFDLVQARLVEALIVARRRPDRERGWLTVQASWPSIVRDRALGDYDIRGYLGTTEDIPPPRMPLSSAEISRMEEAEGWLARFLEEEDRILVLLALGWLAAGRRIGWRRICSIIGAQVGEAALAKRYALAIARIACGLSGVGQAAVQMMVRRHRAEAARAAIGGAVSGAKSGRVRRRKVEYVIDYTD